MDAATEARLASYLNQRQRRLLTMPGLARLRDATITFTSVVNQPDYALPNLSKIARIWELTNERTLFEMTLQDYRLIQPAPMQGTPEAFIWRGHQVVAQQPEAPTTLRVMSSHASDTTVVVYVEGVVTGGWPRSASITLNGVDPINIAAAVATWERVDKFYLAAPTLGAITLMDSANRMLAVIAPGQLTSIYTGLTLYPTPSDVITYYVDITRTVTDLVHGSDQSVIPTDFADVLVLGSLADEYQHLSDARWQLVMTEYKERENQLKYWLAESAVGRPFGLARGWQRPSQLGAWNPAGT